ncbi:hypothetical protein [Microaceticoccus formicicus]|uniref:hypothetical protein n=1 Tax=Microaceticoccus formicicus TaxID=3118105 RepID=UPI003CD023FB|nr:hypothetical protein VZL98_01695 [Peptoniphilaceae bacterium AMB_02]
MIISALTMRGLTMSDMDELTIGQCIDYVIEYNNMNSENEESETGDRQATQADFDSF